MKATHRTGPGTSRAFVSTGTVIDALRELMTPPDLLTRPIGFVTSGTKHQEAFGSKRKNLTNRLSCNQPKSGSQAVSVNVAGSLGGPMIGAMRWLM